MHAGKPACAFQLTQIHLKPTVERLRFVVLSELVFSGAFVASTASVMCCLPLWTCGDCQEDTKVMMVRREDYKRRPQHDGRLEVRLGNEQEVLNALHQWGDNRPGTVWIVWLSTPHRLLWHLLLTLAV